MWIYLIIHVLCIVPCYRLMRAEKGKRKLGDSISSMLCSISASTIILLVAFIIIFSNAEFWNRKVKW